MTSVRTRRSSRLSAKTPSTPGSLTTRSGRQVGTFYFSSESDDDEVQIIDIVGEKTPTKPKTNHKAPLTPSVMLEKLVLTSPGNKPVFKFPTTPSKPGTIESKCDSSSRKELFGEGLKTPTKNKARNDIQNSVTPPKLKKLENGENIPTTIGGKCALQSPEKAKRGLFDNGGKYVSARKALHGSCPTNMPGREQELKELENFITSHLDEGTSGSLYISGPPGTGKTASLNLILQQKKLSSMKHIYLNCNAIKSSGAVFSRLVADLGIKSDGKTEKDCTYAIEKYLKKTHRTILLVLDEIDQLESKNQSVLYKIFEWPSIPRSNLILIGIANALDLTDRLLPRLQSRCELKPKLMHFAPYDKKQIVEIFTWRLKDAGALEVFSPVALQMLAGKVAAISGDVRRALDIGRRVLDVVSRNNKGNVLQALENLDSNVDLKQVVSVLNNVYGTIQNIAEDDDTFPLQQKIIICCLVLILRRAKNKDVTIGRLHEVYRKVCLKKNVQIVDQGEFVGICSLVETRGIIKLIKKKDPRMSKICLVWDEEEVASALRDKQLMSTILEDYDCLGKL